MSPRQLTHTSQLEMPRGAACVVIAVADVAARRDCLTSVVAHTARDVAVVVVLAAGSEDEASIAESLAADSIWLHRGDLGQDAGQANRLTSAVDEVISLVSPADVALIAEPCGVHAGWLTRLREAARSDTNICSASALVDAGGPLGLDLDPGSDHPSELAQQVSEHSLRLRPRLSTMHGPCVYVRREAFDLVGGLDRRLELRPALEIDLAQRCLLSGLTHVAADDVLVTASKSVPGRDEPTPAVLYDRYPHLHDCVALADSPALARALEAARQPSRRPWVTIDARSLTATVNGTQRHVLELIQALAATQRLRLRLVVGSDVSAENLEVLRSLPATELLGMDEIDGGTPRSTLFHRPQQIFGVADLRLAMRLGERIVLSQLDLIAYRNPAYHPRSLDWRSYRRITRQALAVADRVVVFSNHTRAELLSDELAVADRIRIVPPGLDHSMAAAQSVPPDLKDMAGAAGAKQDSPALFLLCLGTDLRHKNRTFALRLLASLRMDHGWGGRLVFAGTHVENGSSLDLERDYLARNPGLANAVTELGTVSEEEKAWLIANAAAVLYPSVYEGFGLVPFEAALRGAPCVFAAQSSLADVVPEDTDVIVPWDAQETAARTLRLLSDPSERERHLEALLIPARTFTWKRTAESMVEVYEEAALAPTWGVAALSRDHLAREQEHEELIAAHHERMAELDERYEHARQVYETLSREHQTLNMEVGPARSLIGPHGTLPDDLQRALLALSKRQALSGPLYAGASAAYRGMRALARAVRGQ